MGQSVRILRTDAILQKKGKVKLMMLKLIDQLPNGMTGTA